MVQTAPLVPGTALRLQLLARDIIVSTEAPRHLSVRNSLDGQITDIQDDGDSDLVGIDIGSARIVARITKAATRDLCLRPGQRAWALVKSVSLRGHAFGGTSRAGSLRAVPAASPDA
jgi:molybdate transport system ATP-binding protein